MSSLARAPHGDLALAEPTAPARPAVLAVVAFVSFAGYATVRWQTMLPASERGRLAAVLAIAVAVLVVGLAAPTARGARVLIVGVACACGLAAVAIVAAIPGDPLLHLRLAVGARELGHAIRELPDVTVPYRGRSEAIRAVIVIGLGLPLLIGAVSLVASVRSRSQSWRLVAALALLVPAMFPSLLGTPALPYLHGVVLLGLVVLLVFGARVPLQRLPGAATLTAVAAGAGVLIALASANTHVSLDFGQLVNALRPYTGARFNWQQTYGPLGKLPGAQPVLEVRARHPAYWKAEDLDEFDGVGWVLASGQQRVEDFLDPVLGVSAARQRQWSELLTVTDTNLSTDEVIAAGDAGPPSFVRPGVEGYMGAQLGTWTASSPLVQGDHYTITAYVPRPTARQLRHAREAVGQTFAPELTMGLPAGAGQSSRYVTFAPYGPFLGPIEGSQATTADDMRILTASPYAQLYGLARVLRSETRTPYGYVLAVERYVRTTTTYVRDPPHARYPIPSFLFGTHRGYCQQYAGTTALLLRMGGIPARVAVGFSPGTYDRHAHAYVVTARDAHAWVEAWFSGYGWVTVDPTASAASAAGSANGSAGAAGTALRAGQLRRHGQVGTTRGGQSARPGAETRASGGHGILWPVSAAALGLVCVIVLAAALGSRRIVRSNAERVDELERALARCGSPVLPGETLVALVRRQRLGPAAAAYVDTLRRGRYAGAAARPTVGQRRAMRRHLSHSEGPAARLRAWLAMPPWRAG